jgi:hypothetical protein
MTRIKIVNGIVQNMSAAEEAEMIKLENNKPSEFDIAMENLRFKRNRLLAETDFYGLSDVTMSSEMETYRQELRDLTNELTTTADVEAVVFPTKP